MLASNIITPFSRDQLILTGKCTTNPPSQATPYQIMVFQSRMQDFLERYFEKTKVLEYDHFVYLDIPSRGKMITTIQLKDINDNPIPLSKDIIRDINLEISIMMNLNPSYLLFYSDKSTPVSRPWIRSILPSLIFEREVYEFFKEPQKKLIPSIVQNGSIYLDLSDDLDFNDTLQKLSSELNQKLLTYYDQGTLPEMLSQVVCADIDRRRDQLCRIVDDPALYQRVPGVFLHYEGATGDEMLEEIAGLPDISIPEADNMLIPHQKSLTDQNMATVFVLNFTKVDPEMNITQDSVGTEFLVSLKKFLDADAVITKEISPGYVEIYIYKNGNYIESALNIKEMFGFQFLTHHPIGLLVAQDLGLINKTKIIYDSYQHKGGVFVPMVHLGDVVQLDLLKIQMTNRMKTVDAYLHTPSLEKRIKKYELKMIGRIDQYLFVEKSSLITKRNIYRSLQVKNAEQLIVGDWDFIRMSGHYIVDITNQLLKEHHIISNPNVRMGPFDSLIVPSLPKSILERLIHMINLHAKEKYNFAREF
jgi:hypothetical protein